MSRSGVFSIAPQESKLEEHSDDNLAWLWLSEANGEQPRYVMMTFSHHNHESYVELNDQAWCCYNCLADTTFFNEGVVIHLKPEAAPSLQYIERIAINFKHLPPETVRRIRSLLATTFTNAMQPIPYSSEE